MPVAKPLHLRLFLEGEEVPVISASISCGVNGPSSAAIQIIPLDEAMDFKPRTMVHLFFYDDKVNINEEALKTGSLKVSGTYRQLWAGEAIGYSLTKTAASRGMVLQCVDFSSYWDSAHATAIEYGPQGNAFTNTGSLYSGDTTLFDDIVEQQANKLVSWIGQSPLTPGLKSVKGLAGGVIRIMEAMGGVVGHHRGINDFFTVADLRCRLLQQVTAEEDDTTAANLLAGKVFDEWIRNGLQNIGQQVTFRDIMQLLFRYIYYEFVPCPAPKYDEFKEGSTKTTTGPERKLSETQLGLSTKKSLQDAIDFVTGLENSSLSNKQSSVNFSLERCKSASSNLTSLSKSSPTLSADTNKVQSKIALAVGQLTQASTASSSDINGLMTRAATSLSEALSTLNSSTRTTKVVVQTNDSTSQRLHMQIIRPDCWFAAPPKCNVIFPEMYTQLSYDRNWMAETTRALITLFNTLVGPDALLSDRILAPPIGTVSKSVAKYTGGETYRVLMDHELHTGIVPVTESLPNTSAVGSRTNGNDKSKAKSARLGWAKKASLFHFFKYRFASRQASVVGRFNPFIVCGFPGVIIQKPFIVPPEVLKDLNIADENEFITKLNSLTKKNVRIPYQLVGMISGVNHNIDQNGGSTSVSFHHVRRHTGIDDEFFDIFFKEDKSEVDRIIRVNITYDQALKDPELRRILIGVTPQNAKPTTPKATKKTVVKRGTPVTRRDVNPAAGTTQTSSPNLSVSSTSENQVAPTEAPPFTKISNLPEVEKTDVLVPEGTTTIHVGDQKGKYKGVVVGIEVLNNGDYATIGNKRVFKNVCVYEKVKVKRQGVIPFEEIVRPSWFSRAYANANIAAQIYNPFFGCGSVVDDLIVQGIAPAEVNFAGENPSPEDMPSDTSYQDAIAKLGKEEEQRGIASVDRAVTVLSFLYGKVKQKSLDVDAFIRSYIDRPIATMEQVLGTSDLSFSVSGNDVTVQTGTVGFHSAAIDRTLVEAGNFAGLAKDLLTQMPRIDNQGKKSSVPPPYDVRNEKKKKVLDYVNALKNGPAFRG